MTILAAIQGRDDIVIFRAHLSTPPLLDLELADSKTWSGRASLRQLSQRGWESRPYQNLQLMAPKGLLDLAALTVEKLAIPMQGLSPRYVRLSLRKDVPNFEIHIPFPDHRNAEATSYFEALRSLARAVTERN
jgi:hypothetical protein